MNRRSSFFRKVTYGVIIAMLLFPLSILSAPATVDSKGGKLAQLRAENGLSQAGLGEIDPASETIKLATLGLRGLAVQFLWNNANYYKKVEDWTNLTATLEQLAKLQPNFVTFWKYQSWNLSYNVSVEFDDYHDRYYWVRRGIQFLEQGLGYNRDNPHLEWEHGWVLGQKVGRADEKVQYRRLFKADDEYHPADRPPADRDNWLVSKKAYLEAVRSVDERGKSLDKKSPAIFYSSAPKSQMNYAEAIEDEGLFDTAVAAWKTAQQDWREFGNIPIEHSTGKVLVFNEQEFVNKEVERLTAQLEGIVGGLREKVEAEAREKLTPEQKAALEIPPAEQDEKQAQLYYEAQSALEVTPEKLAAKVAELEPSKAREAREVAAELMEKEVLARYIRNYKDTTNFDYWALRTEFEQSTAAVSARTLLYRARRLFLEEGDTVQAKELYQEAFARWADVFKEFPALTNQDGTTGDDVMVFVYEYQDVLEQLDEDIPEDFPLWDIIEKFDSEQKLQIPLREHLQRVRASGGATDDATAAEEPAPSAEESQSEANESGSESEATEDSETPADAT
jgi:hypothetical protein